MERFLAPAIIVLLSVILYPVLDSRKTHPTPMAVMIRKQSQAMLSYVQDYDQRFPICQVAYPAGERDIFWHDVVYPYQSWDIYYNSFRALPGGIYAHHYLFQTHQYYAMPPVAATVSTLERTRGYFSWQQTLLTSDLALKFEGIAGHVNSGGTDSYGAGRHDAPSRTLSEISNPGEMIAIAESSNWDFWWSFGNGSNSYAMKYCVRWAPEYAWSSYGTWWGYAGPTASQHLVEGRSGVGPVCQYPNGKTMVASADGRALLLDFRTELISYRQLSDGTYAMKWFWPYGDTSPSVVQSPNSGKPLLRSNLKALTPKLALRAQSARTE